MAQIPKLLSKSRIMKGYQCLKAIYLNVHHRDLEAPVGQEQQALFDQGHVVGAEARTRFPGGVLVDNVAWDFVGSLKRTRELLVAKTEIIYEAAFEYNGCYARADIIQYQADTGRWKVFEVKSSTKLKEEHIDDVGLQAWIMANSGLPIEQINVIYINTLCRFPHLENLFVTEDVTARLREIYPGILPRVQAIYKTIRSSEVPVIEIGPHCDRPYECGFKDHCWQGRLPEVSVFNLPKIGERKWELLRDGVVALDDPRLTGLTPAQLNMVNCFREGQRHIDSAGIQAAIRDWKYPLVYLDFESIAQAIPRFSGVAPYQQVPFQFSVHIQVTPGAKDLRHFEYLHTDASDPRPALIRALIESCGGEGSIVSYYKQFETARIEELAEFVGPGADHDHLLALNARMVDPLPIVRDFVYDNAFAGSFSLKAVAPALLGAESSYAGMEVGDGLAAQRAFTELTSEGVSSERRAELIRASLEYCAKDTLVMVRLVDWLREARA